MLTTKELEIQLLKVKDIWFLDDILIYMDLSIDNVNRMHITKLLYFSEVFNKHYIRKRNRVSTMYKNTYRYIV